MADGSLIIRKKPGIANEKCPTEAQTQVHPEKNRKRFIFLLTLCVTYVTIVNVTLDIDNSWMYQNLPAQTGSNLTAAVSITDDPSGNSSYSY